MTESRQTSQSPIKALSALYLKELSAHVRQKSPANGDRAQGVGRAALGLELSALGVARMHSQAMAALAPSIDFAEASKTKMARAGYFLTQALLPIEAELRTTRATNRLLRQRNETLLLHAAALAKSKVMQGKLRQLTRQIISAQEEERKQISRELHDEVVQTLVGINVQLAVLTHGDLSDETKLKARIARTRRLVENSVNAVHRFARELRPAVLDDLGLIPALLAYCRNLAARKKIKIHLTACEGVELLGNAQRTVLFRVAQEALTNVVRHAQASQVTVLITCVGGVTRMTIRDNGKSFQVDKVLNSPSQRLGLAGMRERVEMVGGKLGFESAPRIGTTVITEIPSRRKRSAK